MKYFIVADIAGQYDALIRLVEKHKDREIILVGDLVDRGPKSREVVEWAMKTPNVTTLMGNHEHMMIDYYFNLGFYQSGIWVRNGGKTTQQSYERFQIGGTPPKEVLKWLSSLPLVKVLEGGAIVSHAPIHHYSSPYDLELAKPWNEDFSLDLIWNRREPVQQRLFQIFGHNSNWGLRVFSGAEGDWAMCIDQSQSEILTGVTWPELEVFTEPYENQKEADISNEL